MIFTGSMEYNGIDFTFTFNGESLHLIPPADKKDEIRMKWFMTEIADGMYTFGPAPKVEAPFLIGSCNETGRTLIFIPAEGTLISNQMAKMRNCLYWDASLIINKKNLRL